MRKQICFLMALVFLLTLLSACAASAPQPSPEPEQGYTDEETPVSSSVGLPPDIWAGGSVEHFYEELAVSDGRVWNGAAWVAPTDPEVTQRQSVEPDVHCDVQWAEGVSGDEEILDTVRDYFILRLTLQCAPDAAVDSSCCTEALREEAKFRAYMLSGVLYHRIEETIELEQPSYPTPDTAEVSVTTDGTQYTSQVTESRAMTQDNYCGALHLTLQKTGGSWVVTDDGAGSGNYFWNGVEDSVQPEADIRQAVEAYFRMRADEMAGQMGDSGCTTNHLLAEAGDFAAAMNIFRVYEAQTRACKYGSPQYSHQAVRVPVTEVMRVSQLYYYQQKPVVGTRFVTVDHTLTLQSNNERYLVVGDLYSYGDHECNILDNLD